MVVNHDDVCLINNEKQSDVFLDLMGCVIYQ